MSERCELRSGLRFGLLGAPAVYDAAGEPRPVRSPKGRALLAALLLEPDRVVSLGALKDALWGDFPPASAQASLQNHVTRLRRLLDDPERLRSVPPGYRLRVAEGELDVRLFETEVARTRAAHAARDWAGASAHAAEALALWRGTPLSGLPDTVADHPLVPRLEEARLLALEWRYDAELELGGGGAGLAALIPELTSLVARHPLREVFHRQLMLTLHRTGRQAEALAVHRELRRRLVEELGVEPGAGVREAHREVLRGESGNVGGGVPVGEGPLEGQGRSAGAGAGGSGGEWVARARAVGDVRAGAPGAVAGAQEAGDAGAAVRGGERAAGARAVGGAQRAGAGDVEGVQGVGVDGGDGVQGAGAGGVEAAQGTGGGGGGAERAQGVGGGGVEGVQGAGGGGGGAERAQGVGGGGVEGVQGAGVDGGDGVQGAGAGGVEAAQGTGGGGGGAERAQGVGGGGVEGVQGAGVDGGDGVQGVGASGIERVQGAGAGAGDGDGDGVKGAGGGGSGSGAGGGRAAAGGGGCGVGRGGVRETLPAQLPPAPAHFTGRGDTVRALRNGLTGGRSVAVVSGMAGVGKSALAVHVAHGLRAEFPDGQLYVHLHGATPGMTPLTPAQALASLLRDLGAEPRRATEDDEDPAAASALLRSLLAPTRTLMVLDDAATAAQVRPLLPAGPGCAVIVTSRSPLTALDGAGRFPLEPLSEGDSAALLRAVSGREGLDAGHPLIGLSGRLPLALRIVAARLAARRALTPDALAELLTDSGGRLHHLEYDDLSVRCSLSVALDALRTSERQADRDAARALARIGALDLPTYGVPLLARLLDTDELRAGAALDRLVDVALLEETAYGRYAPHDLVRDFAREAAQAPGGPEGAGPSVERVAGTALRWYAESARRSLLAMVPDGLDRADRLRGVAARLGPVAAPAPLSMEAAFAWGDTELDNIVALAERYHDTSALIPVLVRCLFPYLQRRGRLTELATLGAAAVAAARRQGDTADEAQALADLAGTHYMSGRGSEALALNDEALALWRGLGIVSCVRRGLNNRGLLLEGLDRYEESADALHQSLALAKELADPLSEAVTLSHLGNLYEHTDARAAIAHHERSLAIGEAIGHVIVRQSAHCNIGYAHLTLGEPAAALAHLEESLRIHDEYEDWHGASQARLGLVRALRELDRHADAGRECAVLLDRAEQRGDTHMAGLARHQHGLLLAAAGRGAAAYAQWESALRALDGTDSKVADELRELLTAR